MTKPDDLQERSRAAGVARILAAARHSVDGARRLWREPACRQEIAAAVGVVALFILKGADGSAYAIFLVLALMVLATEALNTALEEIVDHLSPHWDRFAKHAKDLGSLAVLCQLSAAGLWAAYVLWR